MSDFPGDEHANAYHPPARKVAIEVELTENGFFRADLFGWGVAECGSLEALLERVKEILKERWIEAGGRKP